MSSSTLPVSFSHQGRIDAPMGSVAIALTARMDRLRRRDPQAAERLDALTYVFRRPVGRVAKNEHLVISIRPDQRSTGVSMAGSLETGGAGGLRRVVLRFLRTHDCRALLGSLRYQASKIHRSSGPPGGTPVRDRTEADKLRARGLVPIEVRDPLR